MKSGKSTISKETENGIKIDSKTNTGTVSPSSDKESIIKTNLSSSENIKNETETRFSTSSSLHEVKNKSELETSSSSFEMKTEMKPGLSSPSSNFKYEEKSNSSILSQDFIREEKLNQVCC